MDNYVKKTKLAFKKVKEDINQLNCNISENNEKFIKDYEKIFDEIKNLKTSIDEIKNNKIHHIYEEEIPKLKSEIEQVLQKHNKSFEKFENTYSKEEEFFKKEIKTEIYDELKKEIVTQVEKQVNTNLEKKENKIKDLDYRLHSSELEIYLMKERIQEKDADLKKFKAATKRLIEMVQDLADIEEIQIKRNL